MTALTTVAAFAAFAAFIASSLIFANEFRRPS